MHLASLVTAAGLTTLLLAPAGQQPPAGRAPVGEAPPFAVRDVHGRPVELAGVVAGSRTVVLHFWNTS